jgi:hypothetical protein
MRQDNSASTRWLTAALVSSVTLQRVLSVADRISVSLPVESCAVLAAWRVVTGVLCRHKDSVCNCILPNLAHQGPTQLTPAATQSSKTIRPWHA